MSRLKALQTILKGARPRGEELLKKLETPFAATERIGAQVAGRSIEALAFGVSKIRKATTGAVRAIKKEAPPPKQPTFEEDLSESFVGYTGDISPAAINRAIDDIPTDADLISLNKLSDKEIESVYGHSRNLVKLAEEGDPLAMSLWKDYRKKLQAGEIEGTSISSVDPFDSLEVRQFNEGGFLRRMDGLMAKVTFQRLKAKPAPAIEEGVIVKTALSSARARVAQMGDVIGDFSSTSYGAINGGRMIDSMEKVQKFHDNFLRGAFIDLRNNFHGFKFGAGQGKAIEKFIAEASDDFGQFQMKVIKGLRGQTVEEISPFVTASMKSFRGYLDKMIDFSNSSGLPIRKRENFFPQIWNRDAITAGRERFQTMLLAKFTAEGAKDPKALATEVTNSIIARYDGWVQDIISEDLAHAKRRAINIVGDEYDQWDEFLVTDLNFTLNIYNKRVAGLAQMTKLLGKNGFKKSRTLIEEDYGKAIEEATDAETKQTIKVEMEKQTHDLGNLLYRSLTGSTQGAFDATDIAAYASNTFRHFNTARMMGQIALSSAVDTTHVVMQAVMGREPTRIFRDVFTDLKRLGDLDDVARILGGIEPMETRSGLWAKFAENPALDIRHLKGSGTLIDMANQAERTLRGTSEAAVKFTWFFTYEQKMRMLSSVFAIDEVTRRIPGLLKGTLEKSDIGFMGRLGIDKRRAGMAAEQIQKHSKFKPDGSVDKLNLGAWDETAIEGVEAMQMALRQRVDEVVIRPGIVDSPAFADTAIGSLMFQFQRFDLAMWNRIGRTLPDKDTAEAVAHATSAVFTSALVILAKDIINKREIETDPTDILYEAIHRSGLLGYFSNSLDFADRVGFGPGTLIGAESGARWFERQDPLGSFLGPSWGTVRDLNKVLDNPNFRNVRRLMPFQNNAQLKALETTARHLTGPIIDPEE